MHLKQSLFHPLLRVFCVVMIILIAAISRTGPQEEFIRSADAIVTSIEYKQEHKTKGPLTEYQHLTASYDVHGDKYGMSQRTEMPAPEYRIGDTFTVFYDARNPHETIAPDKLPGNDEIGKGKLDTGEAVSLFLILPFVVTLIGSVIYVEQDRKRNTGRRIR